MLEKETFTLKDAVETYLVHLVDNGIKASTIKVYERALKLALTHFGKEKRLAKILVPHTANYYGSKAVNFHPTGHPKATPTVKQIKRVFRQCMEFAKENGLITVLPIPKVELEHARKKQQAPEKKIATQLRG